MRKARWLVATSAAVALVSLIVGPAHADAIAAGLAAGFAEGVALFFLVVLGPILIPFYAAVIAFIEAYGLNVVLNLGYRRCFKYAFLANIVSTSVGFLWYTAVWLAGGEATGWKTSIRAYWAGDAGVGVFILLFVRSLVVSVAAETLVLFLGLRRERATWSIFTAASFANALSYTAWGVVLLAVGPRW